MAAVIKAHQPTAADILTKLEDVTLSALQDDITYEDYILAFTQCVIEYTQQYPDIAEELIAEYIEQHGHAPEFAAKIYITGDHHVTE